MAVFYGDSNNLETTRSKIVAQVTSLIAQMVTDATDPAIAEVHSTNFETLGLTFNAVTVEVDGLDQSYIAQGGSPIGPTLNVLFQVTLRVMIGNANAYQDTIKQGRLIQSILNWFNENRSLGDQFHIQDEMRAELGLEFEDIQAIGGTITLVVQAPEDHTAA